MWGRLKKLASGLRKCASGNATMLVALGMPVLIGGTGFAVDTAQWYMWKRELQFATDQSALAAAWAMTDEDTKDTYELRGEQEYDSNLATTADWASEPDIQIIDYAAGNDNSVMVRASVTRELPFTSLILGEPTTVAVYSQAQFEAGSTFTSCLIAVDEDDTGAITIGGNSVLTAGCGLAALSNADEAVSVNGDPEINAGWVLARGGIDDWFDENTTDTILEYLSEDELYDPFKELSPPNPAESQVSRTYSCPKGREATYSDVSVVVNYSYKYYKGPNQNNAVLLNPYANAKSSGRFESGPDYQEVASGTVDGTVRTTSSSWLNIGGQGNQKIWEVRTDITDTTYENTVISSGATAATVLPGTYTDLKLSCDTVFTGGVYIIRGGDLDIAAQYNVTGAGVMFVLEDGAGFKINGGSNINLTAMTVSELVSHGVDPVDASQLAGMLVFEARDSEGNSGNKINGNADTVLNGTVYLPKSGIEFAGTASVTSQCLMIAAATITLTGTTNMTSFCPAGVDTDDTVATTAGRVKLVA